MKQVHTEVYAEFHNDITILLFENRNKTNDIIYFISTREQFSIVSNESKACHNVIGDYL